MNIVHKPIIHSRVVSFDHPINRILCAMRATQSILLFQFHRVQIEARVCVFGISATETETQLNTFTAVDS